MCVGKLAAGSVMVQVDQIGVKGVARLKVLRRIIPSSPLVCHPTDFGELKYIVQILRIGVVAIRQRA